MFWLAADLAAALPGGGRARLVGGWGCRRCTQWGACLLCRLPTLPLACFPAPYPPPTPFPCGEGGDPKFISPGATAPGTPTFNRLQHLQFLPLLYPGGGVPALSPPSPALACFPAPLPRRGRISPRPPSPAGKGATKVISCKGLRPLHPRAEPKRRWEQGRTTHPAGACPAGWRLTLPPLYPVGGACLLCRLPALPLACFPAPYPPDPLPRRGRGRPRLFHARGFAPCIPGLNPCGAYRARQAGALRRGEPAVRRKSDRTPFL